LSLQLSDDMRLQRQPNRWSCLPTAFAMALDIPVKEFLHRVGHDGSRIAFPTESEPACRRGFHVQECIDVAVRLGYGVTPIELFPRHAPSLTVPPITITFGNELSNERRFARFIDAGRGVITGLSRNHGHAVAYERGDIYDPAGHVYRYSLFTCESHGFIGNCLWNVQPVLNPIS
jgi:hypothetical protein